MANAPENTPEEPASPDERAPDLEREIARTMGAFRAMARLEGRRGDGDQELEIAGLERRLGALAIATAQYREALPRLAALEAREEATTRELEALGQEVRRGRFRFVHLGAIGCATAIVVAGALAGPAGLTAAATVAGGIVTLVGRDIIRRRD